MVHGAHSLFFAARAIFGVPTKVNFDDVQPHAGRTHFQCAKVNFCRTAQGVALALVDGKNGAVSVRFRARFHFDENERLALSRHDVDFVFPSAIIAAKDFHPVSLQKFGGKIFPAIARFATFGARVDFAKKAADFFKHFFHRERRVRERRRGNP